MSNSFGEDWIKENENRVKLMNIWYSEDGRHAKDHPMHGLFTGLSELARTGKLAGVSADTFGLTDPSSNET
tara:strand:- start:1550 stop:1762 length:213 start_codon:yes stop_codon:yes gene_type:complete